MRKLLLSVSFLLPLPAAAQDAALLLGVDRYEQLERVRNAARVPRAADRFEALGFEVQARANPRVDAARDLSAAFQADVADADRLVVALTGYFVTDGARTWLLTAEADAPDLFDVNDAAISVDSLLLMLAQRPGKAVLVLGVASPNDQDQDGSALAAGVGTLAVPQGVTVIRANPRDAATVLATTLTEPEAVIGEVLATNNALEIDGFLPLDWQLMPSEVLVEDVTEFQGPTQDDLNAEASLWDATTAADTVIAYRRYLARYPDGRFVAEAEEQIAAILAEPNRAARLAEEALGLSRNDRRDVQANLTLLNYNTRGVDGIFGPGSRGAILNWQQSNGFPQTSYLTRDQINLLDAQAARRQAEIDAEEARALAAQQARDREYWAETGGRGDEPGYRAYLARYPDGLFAAIAQARLAEIEDRRAAEAEVSDRAAWSIAQSQDTVPAYQEYLASHPQGLFADRAQARIEEMSGPSVTRGQIAQAREEEGRLRLTGVRAQLLELRLRDLGFNPGRLDGVINDSTRAAIRAYQESEGIPATGFVDQQTAVGLMTGSINITIPSR